MDDTELLNAFIERRDPDAFRQIVARYVAVVYAAARRQVGATHLAEDITQAVFMMLSQRAHKVRGGAVLAGWLVNATRLAAKSAARNERRLKLREQKVAMMKPSSTPDTPEFLPGEIPGDLLDAALARLRPKDRTAITLRYLQGKSTAEVAATMGISEAAAAKRVTRAVGKLRSIFNRRGMAASTTAAVIAALSTTTATAAITVPAGLAERAASTALTAHTALSASAGVASLIAKGAIVSMKAKSLVTAGVIAALLLVLGGGITLLALRANKPSAETPILAADPTLPAPPAAPAAGNPPAADKPLKVGIVLADATASAQADGSKTFGYGNQSRITDELHFPGIQLIPVIEPGTEKSPALVAVLQQQFTNATPINGYDAQALKQLDVIVAAQIWVAKLEMIAAVNEAVNDGTGLLIRQAFGDAAPGFTPGVLRLHGLKQASVGETDPWRNPAASEIIGEHVILGDLSGKLSTPLDALACGAFGTMTDDAVPLIRAKDIAQLHPTPDAVAHKDWVFYPLYTARLGRGKIIACNFDVHAPPPSELQAATKGMFTIQCVQWLAAQHEAAATQPATTLPADPPVIQFQFLPGAPTPAAPTP